MILVALPRRVTPTSRPPFSAGVSAVDEGFGEVDLSALVEISRESAKDLVENTFPLPLLEASMHGLIRRVAPRQIRPRRSGPQHPEDRVKDVAWISPRPTSLLC